MTSRSFSLLVASVAVVAAGVSAVSVATAVTTPYVSYSAVGCQPFQGKADGYRDVDGSIRNRSTASWGDYLCPVRQAHAFESSYRVPAYVHVIDTSTTASVWCHIYTYTEQGRTSGWTMKSTSRAGFSSSAQKLQLATSDGKGVWQVRNGHATIRCTLPPKQNGNESRVVSYHVAD